MKKEKVTKRLKQNKGITLIALVITIIVLLILAGVTIAAINSNESAPNKAVEARTENQRGAAKDAATLLVAEKTQGYYEDKYVNRTSNVGTVLDYLKDSNVLGGTNGVTTGEYTVKIETNPNDNTTGKITVTKGTGANAEVMATGIVDASGIITWDSVPNAGDAGDQGGDQQGGTDPDPAPATGSKITVGGTDIDLSTLDATTVAVHYGKTVATVNNVEYGLFYVDYAGDYGEEGTVYLRAKSSVGSIALNNPSLSDDALAIMKDLNPDWNEKKGTVTTSAEQAAEHLCNPAVTTWSGIKTNFETLCNKNQGDDYVNYVVGAPSIEMFLASYNAKYPVTTPSDSTPEYSAAFKAANEVYTYPGYLYGKKTSASGNPSYATSYGSAIQQTADATVGAMYRNTSVNEWLASPLSSGYDNCVCVVASGGDLNCNGWSRSNGVAPLVSLKSGVDLTTSTTPGE